MTMKEPSAMILDQILDLHPRGADAATLRAAVAKAEELQGSLRRQADTAMADRERNLLTRSDKELQAQERDAAAASLAAARIAALLPAMRKELAAAEGREALEELRIEAAGVIAAQKALEAWHSSDLEQLKALMDAGFRLQDAATEARSRFLARVQEAYAREDVRTAGPLGVAVPVLPAEMPRSLFPNWR